MTVNPVGVEPEPIVNGAAYLNLPREVETWLIRPIVPAGGAVILYGDAKVGKSYAALQLAVALQEGGTWMGFPVEKTGPVVYIQLDTPRSLWASRLEQLRAGGVSGVEKVAFADRETLQTFPFDILNPDHSSMLKEALGKIKPIAVVIDTIRESHSGDENDSTAMRNVIGALVDATQPAAMILISHSRKPSQDGHKDLLSDQRGSNYVVGRMDAIIRFSKRSIHLTGRAIEEGSVKTDRLDNGFWEVVRDEVDAAVASILADTSTKTVREKARRVAERCSISENAARMRLRRAKAA